MNRRQAKKIQRRLREDQEAVERYRWSTLKAVGAKGWRSWIRYADGYRKRTRGWRWGRWDPDRPTPPGELPF